MGSTATPTTIPAKMLRNQILKSRRRNRRTMKGQGFEQMVVGNGESKGQWIFDRRSKCRHCHNAFRSGEVVLVSADMDVIIHADCLLSLAEGIVITDAEHADLEAEKLRIMESGAFYGER